MQIQTVRTTLTLPKDIHELFKYEALAKGTSMNELLVSKLIGKKRKKKFFKVESFTIGVKGKLNRENIYNDILDERIKGTR